MRRDAFTLVELLVVVAIVGLLLSVLIPGLAAAREAARSAKCKSNLRQLQMGWNTYILNDARQLIPYTSTTGHPNWVEYLDAAFPDAVMQFGTDADSYSNCPTIRANYQKMLYVNGRWGYAINTWWTDAAPGQPAERNHLKRWSNVRSPSSYPWLFDGDVRKFGSGHSIAPYAPYETTSFGGTPNWGIGPIHAAKAVTNVAHADGSVSGEAIESIRAGLLGADRFPWLSAR